MSKWVVPSDTNADVRELLNTKCNTHYKVVLALGVDTDAAEALRRQVGANIAFHAREINSLFRLFQKHRKAEQDAQWVVVFFPGKTHPVSKAYNRILKDTNLDVVVVSTLRGVVKDDRLVSFSTDYIEIPEPKPRYWVASWLI